MWTAPVEFLYSFVVYYLCRLPDEFTTKKVASMLSLELHEVNPLLVKLSKRMSLSRSMLISGVFIGICIGTADTVTGLVRLAWLPPIALVFGSSHLLAAANNAQVYFNTKLLGPDVVEENTRYIASMLSKLPFRSRLWFSLKIDFYSIFLGVFSLVAYVLFFTAIIPANATFYGPRLAASMVDAGIALIIGLITFFAAVAFGHLLINSRRGKSPTTDEESSEGQTYLKIPVQVGEIALAEAKRNHAEYLSIPLQLFHDDLAEAKEKEVKE